MEGRSRPRADRFFRTRPSGPFGTSIVNEQEEGACPGARPLRYGDYSASVEDGSGGAAISGAGSSGGTVRLRNGWMWNSASFWFRLP